MHVTHPKSKKVSEDMESFCDHVSGSEKHQASPHINTFPIGPNKLCTDKAVITYV